MTDKTFFKLQPHDTDGSFRFFNINQISTILWKFDYSSAHVKMVDDETLRLDEIEARRLSRHLVDLCVSWDDTDTNDSN